jgi:hypothetical protein
MRCTTSAADKYFTPAPASGPTRLVLYSCLVSLSCGLGSLARLPFFYYVCMGNHNASENDPFFFIKRSFLSTLYIRACWRARAGVIP